MEQDTHLLELTADIVAAHVTKNTVGVADLPGLVQKVYEALSKLGAPSEEEAPAAKPAVSVRSSVKRDHLVCLVCGARQKTLRRHIAVAHEMKPEDYRARFNLPASYPMVAPDYTDRRREIAHSLGLGRGRRKAAPKAPEGGEAPPAKPRRGRRRSS